MVEVTYREKSEEEKQVIEGLEKLENNGWVKKQWMRFRNQNQQMVRE